MGKRAEQAKKRRRLANQTPNVAQIKVVEGEDSDGYPAEDLAITIATLNALAENPADLASKSMKDLKRAIFNVQRATIEGNNIGERQNPDLD